MTVHLETTQGLEKFCRTNTILRPGDFPSAAEGTKHINRNETTHSKALKARVSTGNTTKSYRDPDPQVKAGGSFH